MSVLSNRHALPAHHTDSSPGSLYPGFECMHHPHLPKIKLGRSLIAGHSVEAVLRVDKNSLGGESRGPRAEHFSILKSAAQGA